MMTTLSRCSRLSIGSFAIVFKENSAETTVKVKKMKEIGAGGVAVRIPQARCACQVLCEQIVHFYGACFIPNHIMMVTEFAPCGSLADCVKKRDEPSERLKAKLMLDATKGLVYLHSNGILHRESSRTTSLSFLWMRTLLSMGS